MDTQNSKHIHHLTNLPRYIIMSNMPLMAGGVTVNDNTYIIKYGCTI